MNTVENQKTQEVARMPQEMAGKEVKFTMPTTEELAELRELNTEFRLTTKYRTQEEWYQFKDKPIRAYYKGMTEVPNKDGELVAVGIFVAQDGVFLSGQMTLMESVRDCLPGTPLQITYEGKKANKSNDGYTNIFDVQRLA